MSQHFYKTTYKNRPVEVVMGWDRPTQEYFLWIEYIDNDEDEEEEFLWHSMDCHVAFPEEIAFILRVLTDFKIEVPSVMIRAVEEDCLQNVGNKEVIYAQPVEDEKTSLPDFNIGEAYSDLISITQVIIECVITGMSDDKITISNPDSLEYIDFEGEGLILYVSDDLSELIRDLQSNYIKENNFESHRMFKYILIKIYQMLEDLGGSDSEQVGWVIEDADSFDDTEPQTSYEEEEEQQLVGNDFKDRENLFNTQKVKVNSFDLHEAYRELIEIIYSIINVLGRAVKKRYFAKAGIDYLTLAHGEFISKRAKEILCDNQLKKMPSSQKNQMDNKIYPRLHKQVVSFLKAISEVLDYEKPLSSCSLF